MKKKLEKFIPSGTIHMQPSKSILHRALICAALARGKSELLNFAWSDDIQATVRCLEGLGLCRISVSGAVCSVEGGLHLAGHRELDCGESGSTIRFLMPLAMNGEEHVFTGRGRLMQRPFGPYEAICKEQGITFVRDEDTITVEGNLRPGNFVLPGNISSQFISGMLLALPLLDADSHLTLSSPLESAGYVEITRAVQELFNVRSVKEENGFAVAGNQKYEPVTLAVEGDFSHATFFAVAAALAGEVNLAELNPASVQGDRAVFDLLEDIGAQVTWEGNSASVRKGDLRPFDVDVSQIPDAVPALAVLAAGIDGTSRIYNAGRVRLKESDRLAAMAEELAKLGCRIEQSDDELLIHGTGRLQGGEVSSHDDHRVAMALTVASLLAEEPVILENAEVVAKSGPQFFHEWEVIGGESL